MIQVTFQKNLIALEDLLVGVGTAQQQRGNDPLTLVTVTKINGSNLPYDGTRSMQQVIDNLQAEIDALPIVIDQFGNLLTGLIDSSNSDLSSTHSGRIWQKTISSVQTNVYWGNILMYQYNPTTGNLIVGGSSWTTPLNNEIARAEAAETAIVTAYEAADTAIVTAYEVADAVVTAAFGTADAVVLASAEAYALAQIAAAADYVDFTINQTQQAVIAASTNVTKTVAYTSGAWTPITVSSNFTLAFTFPANKVCSMILAITNGGAYTITWPAGMLFPEGSPPVLTASGLDLVTVFQDGSNTQYAAVVGNAFAT